MLNLDVKITGFVVNFDCHVTNKSWVLKRDNIYSLEFKFSPAKSSDDVIFTINITPDSNFVDVVSECLKWINEKDECHVVLADRGII